MGPGVWPMSRKRLIRLLKTKELTGQKVLLFTEFADTARYVRG